MNYILEAIYELNRLEESKREERVIKGQMRILLTHMLKAKYQPEYEDKSSWKASINNSHRAIIDEFKEKNGKFSGSLYKKFYGNNFNLDRCYKLARDDAIDETGLDNSVFPEKCEWSKEQLIDSDYIRQFVLKYCNNK